VIDPAWTGVEPSFDAGSGGDVSIGVDKLFVPQAVNRSIIRRIIIYFNFNIEVSSTYLDVLN
jgi:hypothetical protein